MVIKQYGQGLSIPDDLLQRAQEGDAQCRETIIETMQPYVVRIASNYCGRFLQAGTDEEISIAMLALNEAIDGYQQAQGTSFHSFVQVVVKRRLIDYFRRNQARRLEIPFSEFQTRDEEDESAELTLLEQKEAEKIYLHQEEARDRREEITYYTKLLEQYGITLSELVKCSPKHKSARERAIMAAQIIAGEPKLVQYFKENKALPLKEIEGRLPFSRKTLERHRKYIVALLLVYLEDLPHIREYLKGKGDHEA